MASQDIEITTRGDATTADSCGCGCCGGESAAEQPVRLEPGAGSAMRQYAVTGMTCGHCVGAVTQQLSELSGVEAVDVTLVADGTSTVTVTSWTELSDDAVAAAIEEAGYAVVTP